MEFTSINAPGSPGYPLPWASSKKSGVGVAANESSRVWFTIASGIVTEVFYPRIDMACIRDFQFLVADSKEFFAEERRDTQSSVRCLEDGVPGYRITNVCSYGKYTLTKEVITNPDYHSLLIDCHFEPSETFERDPRLYATLAPRHTCPCSKTSAKAIRYKGHRLLTSERDQDAMAMACSAPFSKVSVGYIGASDGWTDVANNKRMTASYGIAKNGNVGLVGQIDWKACQNRFCIAIGFGRNLKEAVHRARGSILQGFARARKAYIQGWNDWHETLRPIVDASSSHARVAKQSAAVLATHQARNFHGGVIASLSCPWGNIHTDDDLGGYHLIWPRDLYHATVGFMAIGAKKETLAALDYFQCTQEADGHWPQSMWLDGDAYGDAKQLDETAAPILAISLARQRGFIDDERVPHFWPMVEKAADYIEREGPSTHQDRWEELGGISLYTVAISVAALLEAAEIASAANKPGAAARWRSTADAWNASIDDWCYVRGTELAKAEGVDGYYIRIRPVDEHDHRSPLPIDSPLYIANRAEGERSFPAWEIVSPDVLALVRFGLRRPDDPKVLNTLKVVDSLLKVDTDFGPSWKRYNNDGYGEKSNGDPFDGTGIGRPWPMLTGERAHYELAAGNRKEAARLLHTLELFAGECGLIPEQIWDQENVPGRSLQFGRATGSARPLVWAHAEYLTLLRSLKDGHPFDFPPAATRRYVEELASH